LNVRPGTISDIPAVARVYAGSWRTTYEGLVPDAFLKAMTLEAATKNFTDCLQPNSYSYFLHVAEENGKIVGFADGGKERSHPESGVGELYAIYILKEFQGKGIGKALFQEAVRSLKGSGMDSMVAWMLEKSPYWKFYELRGGKRAPGSKKLDLGGDPILLVSYVWEKLL